MCLLPSWLQRGLVKEPSSQDCSHNSCVQKSGVQQMPGQFARSHQCGGTSVLGLHFKDASVPSKDQGTGCQEPLGHGHLSDVPEEEEE